MREGATSVMTHTRNFHSRNMCFEYRIAAKYSNRSMFQHWLKEGRSITSWKCLMPRRAQAEGASNATLGGRVWYHLAKLHVCEVRKAFEYLEVIRYFKWMLFGVHWLMYRQATSSEFVFTPNFTFNCTCLGHFHPNFVIENKLQIHVCQGGPTVTSAEIKSLLQLWSCF